MGEFFSSFMTSFIIIFVFLGGVSGLVFYIQDAFIERQYNRDSIDRENARINEAMMSRKIYNQDRKEKTK